MWTPPFTSTGPIFACVALRVVSRILCGLGRKRLGGKTLPSPKKKLGSTLGWVHRDGGVTATFTLCLVRDVWRFRNCDFLRDVFHHSLFSSGKNSVNLLCQMSKCLSLSSEFFSPSFTEGKDGGKGDKTPNLCSVNRTLTENEEEGDVRRRILPCFFSLSNGRVAGRNISISSGTLRTILKADSTAWKQNKLNQMSLLSHYGLVRSRHAAAGRRHATHINMLQLSPADHAGLVVQGNNGTTATIGAQAGCLLS